MAEDILSQDEVDALLRGVSGDAEEQVADDGSADGVRAYDIGRQERIVRGRMPTLELINERFARLLRISLYSYLRRSPEISVGPVRVIKYSDFTRNLPVPTNLNLVHAKPLRGTALFVLDPNLVFQVIDCLFGGSGKIHTRVEGRDFTATELRIIQNILRLSFADYEKSWQPVHPLRFEYVRSEMNTQFANIATPTEVVVVSTFTIDLGSGGGEFNVCMPYAMMEPLRDVIYSGMQADRSESDARWVTMLTRQIQDAEVDLVANLGTATVTLRDLMQLEVGDVIGLNMPDSVVADVDGIPVLDCSYGVTEGRYALKVNRFVNAPAAVLGERGGSGG
ncbi:MAG: flagellar motor switch protein FliM [Burkholderiales bacterium]|nr:flagellar motor switch protein FliM [Burkholderiales bacterium]